MAQEDAYFQFPISLLRGKRYAHADIPAEPWKTSQDLCQTIVSVGMDHMTEKTEPQAFVIQRYVKKHGIHRPQSDYAQRLITVADVLGVAMPPGKPWVSIQSDANRYPDGGTQCRIRSDILWSMHDEQWPLQKMRTLIAIYAGIGHNTSQWLAYSRLRFLAAGYSGRPDAEKHFKRGVPTEKSVRYWAERLWAKHGFFQLVLQSNNRRIYSNKFKDDLSLRTHILERKRPSKKLETL